MMSVIGITRRTLGQVLSPVGFVETEAPLPPPPLPLPPRSPPPALAPAPAPAPALALALVLAPAVISIALACALLLVYVAATAHICKLVAILRATVVPTLIFVGKTSTSVIVIGRLLV